MSSATFENIYYLGPDGSNAHFATTEFLKKSGITVKNKIPKRSIRTAIEDLQTDFSAICVLPIENSLEGIVRETIYNIQILNDKDIQIKGEITIPINHSLLANTTNKAEIKKIISHPQALAQCGNYLHKHFPVAEIGEVSSTSYAAQKISQNGSKEIAAIANESCSKIFNLNILEKNINDEQGNQTRFYILGRENLAKLNTGKTAIMLATKNEPGALCHILQIFEKHNINLTYIDSRPSRRHLGEYLFFLEIDGLYDDYKIKIAVEEILKNVEFYKHMGSFYLF